MLKFEEFSHFGYKKPHEKVKQCEDRIYKGNTIFAVIDGATSVSNVHIEGLTDGAYIAEFFQKSLADFEEKDTPAFDILSSINKAFGEELQNKHPEVAKLGKHGPCASGVIVKIHENGKYSYAQVGDCMLIEGSEEHLNELTKDTRYHDDMKYLEVAQKLAKEKDCTLLDVRQYDEVIGAIKDHREMSNVKKGVITGEAEMDKFIAHGCRSVKNIESLTLMSDGMSHPEYGLEQTYLKAAEHMLFKGIEDYYQHLKNIFNDDINWKDLRYPRGKHMDDASALIIRFE